MQAGQPFWFSTTKITRCALTGRTRFEPYKNTTTQHMRSILITLSICLCIFTTVGFLACKKDDNNNGGGNTTACNGMNFCMKVDGTTVSKNASWKVLTNRNRVLWEEGTGTSYTNVELDVYGSTTGSYTISPAPGAGGAGFQYFMGSAVGNKNIVGQSGTVNVTSVTATTMTGTFTVTGKDAAGTTYQITDGNFVAVPK